jgi:mutator protein MutT
MKAIDVAAALLFRDRKLLITQRYEGSHLGGLWEFPGGKREPNETFEQCLVRELQEELGIEAEVLDLVESLTHAYPEKTVNLKFFRCRWRKNEPQALGCPAFAWISQQQLTHYEFPAADARLLTRLEQDTDLWRTP